MYQCRAIERDVSSFLRQNFVVLSLGVHPERVCTPPVESKIRRKLVLITNIGSRT